MRITSVKVDYALRALVDLAAGSRPRQSADLAQRWGIPHAYLERLLTTLRNAGLVHSQRGPQGGHMLRRPAASLTVLDVWEALEGPITSITPWEDTDCTNSILPGVWDEINAGIAHILGSITLADLADRQAAR